MKRIFLILTMLTLLVCAAFTPKAFKNHIKTNAALVTPKMAIVIDDFGSFDQSGVETLSKCPEKLTCAVLPNVDNSTANAKQFADLGHEIILHMPMQSHVNLPEDWYGPVYIKNHDSPETATKKLESCLKEFENIKGFNIHIGSGVSQNQTLMTAIYNFETKATENACKNTGSVYLGRDVFLEADKNRSYAGVCNRLLETANLAKQNGTAIAIGHVGAEGGENTAKAIIDTLPKIKEMGVKIVPLHEIYETLKNQ